MCGVGFDNPFLDCINSRGVMMRHLSSQERDERRCVDFFLFFILNEEIYREK